MALNILIVDDSVTVRAVIVKTLDMAGIETGMLHQAAEGGAALELLRTHWIDLVLADLNMPGMNGLELVASMKADESLADIPVLIVSTEGSRTRVDDLRRQGIAGFLRKPFTPESLKESIESALAAPQGGG
jgi:two-component system chemotaxis response regulator CheY